MVKIFIDGQAGTTGLELTKRLAPRADVTLLEIDPAERKDRRARRCLMDAADVTVLCLPDDAAKEAVALAGDDCRLLDASTAHRVAPGWVYGCPEMAADQRDRIAAADRVTNPGCYPQGFILLVRPLIQAGLLPPEQPLSVFGTSGYSGGGHTLIETYQAFSEAERERWNTRPYALTLTHKHVPEMREYSGTARTPLFAPSVGHFFRGMLVQIPLFLEQLNGAASAADLQGVLSDTYAGEPFVEVLPCNPLGALDAGFLAATECNNSNRLQLMVFGHESQALLFARYDNLGKGAAGAAIQNLNIMLGQEETTGLAA